MCSANAGITEKQAGCRGVLVVVVVVDVCRECWSSRIVKVASAKRSSRRLRSVLDEPFRVLRLTISEYTK